MENSDFEALNGKKAKILDDMEFGTVHDILNVNIGGFVLKGKSNDSMIPNSKETAKVVSYLKKLGLVKNDDVIIPAGTVVTLQDLNKFYSNGILEMDKNLSIGFNLDVASFNVFKAEADEDESGSIRFEILV